MPDFPMLAGIQPDGLPFRDTRSPYATHAERLRFGQTSVRDGARVPQAATAMPAERAAPAPRPDAAPAVRAEREPLPTGRVFTDEPAYASRIQPRVETPAAPRATAPPPPAQQGSPPALAPQGPPAATAMMVRPEAMRLQSLLDGILAAGPRLPPPVHRRVAGDLTEADTEDLFEVADPDEVADTGATARAPGER